MEDIMSKFVFLGKLLSSVIYILLIIFAIGCSKSSNTNKWVDLEVAMEEDVLSEKIESHVNLDEQKNLFH